MSDLEHIRVEWDGELAVVTIDRQEKLNALNADVIRELAEVFDNLDSDRGVRAVIVTSANDRTFVRTPTSRSSLAWTRSMRCA